MTEVLLSLVRSILVLPAAAIAAVTISVGTPQASSGGYRLIVPGKSIGSAILRMPKIAADRALGQSRCSNDPQPLCAYERAGLTVAFTFYPLNKLNVAWVLTSSPTYKTAQGVGVGSTLAQLRRAYPDGTYKSRTAIFELIHPTGGFDPYTDFWLAGSKVVSVEIGFISTD